MKFNELVYLKKQATLLIVSCYSYIKVWTNKITQSHSSDEITDDKKGMLLKKEIVGLFNASRTLLEKEAKGEVATEKEFEKRIIM